MEVNGRPVFAFVGEVPMHRTIAPGATAPTSSSSRRRCADSGYGAP